MMDKKTVLYLRKKKGLACVTKKNIISGNIKIIRRIGEESKNGEVMKACLINKKIKIARSGSKFNKNNCSYNVSVKKIPLEDNEFEMYKTPESKKTLNKSNLFSELYFLKLVNRLVDQKICMNLPLFFNYFVCDKCNFNNNKIILSHFPGVTKCVYVISELADYTLKIWLDEKKRSRQEILSAYLQIFMGLYCIKKYFNIWHHDLHGDNILVKKVAPGGCWKYKVGENNILIPNYGFIFIIWDFGYSRIPGKIEPSGLNWLHKNEPDPLEDYHRITNWVHKTGKLIRVKIGNTIIRRYMGSIIYEDIENIIEESETQRDIVMKLSSIVETPDTRIIETFNTDTKLITKDLTIF